MEYYMNDDMVMTTEQTIEKNMIKPLIKNMIK
jgi:hypothetical protein